MDAALTGDKVFGRYLKAGQRNGTVSVASALPPSDTAAPAFVRDLDTFRSQLEALPNIAHALASGHILPILDSEIRQTFLACIDVITDTPGMYETAWRQDHPDEDTVRIDPALFQETFGIDLVKALWAGQFPRKLELGDVLDVSQLSDDDLARLFNRKPQ